MIGEKPQPLRPALFFLVVLACYGLFLNPLPGDNVNSRLDLAASLINNRLIHIDRYHDNTIDKAFSNGHFYSDKAPGMAWWTALAAYPLQKVLFFRVNPNNSFFRHVATVLIVSIPSTAAVVLMVLLLMGMGAGAGRSLTVSLFFALGTLHFPYSTMFYSHALTGALSLAVFAIIFRRRKNGRTMGPGAALLCGLLAGAMTAGEYPAALTAVLLFGYSLFAARRRWHAAFFILGMAPFAAAVMAYNNAAFGSPFTTGYVNESLPVFNESMARGFAGITVPSLATVYKILLSPGRGFLWQSPFLLFAIPGWLAMRRRAELRVESWFIAAIALEIVAVGVSAYMPEGGMAVGPRYLIPALPFLCMPLVFCNFEKQWLRRIFIGLGFASIILMFVATATDPQVPREFDATIIEFNLPLLLMPLLRAGGNGYIYEWQYPYHALKTFFPLVLLTVGIIFILKSALPAWISETYKSSCAPQEPKNINRNKQLFVETAVALIATAIFLGSFYALNFPYTKNSSARKYCAMGSYFRRLLGDYDRDSPIFKFESIAMHWYEKGVEAEGDAWECHFGLGMLHQKRERLEEAEKHYLEVIRTGHELPQAYYNLGDIYRTINDYDLAFKMLEHSAKLHLAAGDKRAAADVYFIIARLKDDVAPEDAENVYLKAINIAPNLDYLYYGLIKAYENQNRFFDAERASLLAKIRFPAGYHFHAFYARALSKTGRKKEALAEIAKSLSYFRNDERASGWLISVKREIEAE